MFRRSCLEDVGPWDEEFIMFRASGETIYKFRTMVEDAEDQRHAIAHLNEMSGPVFKAYSGRTRRNSGIPSGICRYCDGVVPVSHDYPL